MTRSKIIFCAVALVFGVSQLLYGLDHRPRQFVSSASTKKPGCYEQPGFWKPTHPFDISDLPWGWTKGRIAPSSVSPLLTLQTAPPTAGPVIPITVSTTL